MSKPRKRWALVFWYTCDTPMPPDFVRRAFSLWGNFTSCARESGTDIYRHEPIWEHWACPVEPMTKARLRAFLQPWWRRPLCFGKLKMDVRETPEWVLRTLGWKGQL